MEVKNGIMTFTISIPTEFSRADTLQARLIEAYYSSHEIPDIRSYDDLLRQVADLLAHNPYDTRPIQILYTFFVKVGSEHMEKTMQDVGQYMLRLYSLPFAHIEHVLNHVMKRIAALGRLRHLQSNPSYSPEHVASTYQRHHNIHMAPTYSGQHITTYA